MADIVNFSTRELDFDSIVTNLKEFMRYQDEFSDYDFAGSALSTLINTLAYNTHYNGVYDNFAVNESFIDSAIKRSSVISHANLVNYTPRSAKAATATINITVYDEVLHEDTDTFELPRYASFTTTIDGEPYNFTNMSSIRFSHNDMSPYYTITGAELKQGTVVTTTQKYTGSSSQKFILANDNVDIDTIHVEVEGSEITTFTRASDIIEIDNNSKVYFLTMNGNGYYQIQFGSGMMGYSLSAGDVVHISYVVTDGERANGARTFAFSGTASTLGFSNSATLQVTCTSKSVGGGYPEDTESIRLLAPRMYTSQNRCVTESDYQNIIKSYFNNAKSVKVWGGEKNNPPQYGKVFISVISKTNNTLSNAEKSMILDIVEKRRVLGCGDVEIVDPSILNVHVNCTVYYNPHKSINTAQDIETMAKRSILSYSDKYLGDFNSVMKYSNLVHDIDMCDGGIAVQNNNTRIHLSSTINPQYNVLVDYVLDFNNAIHRAPVATECVFSSGFYCTYGKNNVCYIDDDPVNGVLRLFYIDEKNRKIVIQNIGTVDYVNGRLTISKLNITSLVDDQWRFTIDPASNDVITKQNQFAVISSEDLIVNAVSVASDSSYVQVNSK